MPLTKSPPPMYGLGTHRWCPRACASATTIWVCLLLFPRHFCHSYVIFFYYAYCVMFIFYFMRNVWAFGLVLPSFVPPWTGHCPDKGLCLYSPFGFYFYRSSFFPWVCQPRRPIGLVTSFLGLPQPLYFIFTSYSSHGFVDSHSCHVSPLGLITCFYNSYFFFLPLPLLLGFFCYQTFRQKCTSTPFYSILLITNSQIVIFAINDLSQTNKHFSQVIKDIKICLASFE